MGILINNMKIIHTSTFTIIHTNCNHYLETTQRKQREIIRRKESVSHKEEKMYTGYLPPVSGEPLKARVDTV